MTGSSTQSAAPMALSGYMTIDRLFFTGNIRKIVTAEIVGYRESLRDGLYFVQVGIGIAYSSIVDSMG